MGQTVSVILAVRNGENYLREALDSLFLQTHLPHEVILIDDGSTDATKNIALSYPVLYFFQNTRGLGASRNRGISLSSGSLVTFIDHDDWWPQEKLSSQIAAWETHSLDPLVFGFVEQFFCPSLLEEEKRKLQLPSQRLPGYIAGTLLCSKKRMEEIGPFLEEKELLGEFVEWYLRACRKNTPSLLLEETLLHRRIHRENMGRLQKHRRADYLHILHQHLAKNVQSRTHDPDRTTPLTSRSIS